MTLFHPKKRTRLTPKGFSESYWRFMDETANPADVAIRTNLEDWFKNYASGHPAVRDRLRTGLQADERAAFFELFLNELLRRLGCQATVHPDIPNVTGHPDFLAVPDSGQPFYLEAVAAEPKALRSQRRQTSQTVDFLSALEMKHASLLLTGDVPARPGPWPKTVREFFENEAAKFSVDDLRERYQSRGIDALPRVRHPDTGIEGILLPRPESLTGSSDDRGVSGFATSCDLSDYPEIIQRAVLEKGSHGKYGRLDCPLVVAVDIPRFNFPEALIEQGLYGGALVGKRIPGAFESPGRSAMTTVSAVLTFLDVHPASFHCAPVALWHNPNAAQRIGPPLTRLNQRHADVPGVALHEVFGVPADWHLRLPPPL